MNKLNTIKNLISVEGIDGSGKSTFTNEMKKFFSPKIKIMKDEDSFPELLKINDIRYDVSPFDPIATTYIRSLLSNEITTRGNLDLNTKNNSLLYAFISDFVLHQKSVLDFTQNKAQKQLSLVISDRYLLSTIAYQSLNIDFDVVCDIIKKSKLSFPKLIIYLDCDPNTALERITKNRNSTEIFEKVETLKNVYDNYNKAINWVKDNVEDCKIIRINSNNVISSYEEEIKRVAEICSQYNIWK